MSGPTNPNPISDDRYQLSFSRDKGTLAIILIGALWILLAMFVMPPAGFSIDDFIYQAMIDAFAGSGSLFVENGYAEHRVDALRNLLMLDVDGKLAPQYPGGWGIIAAPAYMIAGLNGVMTLNAVACALALWLVWQTAWSMFEDRRLATYAALFFGLCSFAVDYALAIWPHGIAMFCATAAMAALAKDIRTPTAPQAKWLLIAGLFLGIGVNFRADTLFLTAPACVWLLASSYKPFRSTAIFLTGLIPGLAASAIINWLKFGIANPITYGGEGGALAVGHYAQLIPVLLAGIVGAIALGSTRLRAIVYQPKILGVLCLATILLTVSIPPLRELAVRFIQGFWILVVDFQALPRPNRGMLEMEDGTFRMYSLIKKALLQSMPYLAIVILLAPRILKGPDRSALMLCVLIFSITAIPFAYTNWHGGQASNMRYFANLIPALVILAAAAFRQIEDMMTGKSTAILLGVLGLTGLATAWPLLSGYGIDFTVQNRLPNVLVAALALSCVAVLLTNGRFKAAVAQAIYGLTIAGLLTAALTAWVFDLKTNIIFRMVNHQVSNLTQDLPADALVITNGPVRLAFRLNQPPAMTARVDAMSTRIDASLVALVTDHLKQEKPVFVQGRQLADQFAATGFAVPGPPRYDIPEVIELFELAQQAN